MNAAPPPQQRPALPTFGEAFLYWLKLGFISFGGPAGQIAFIALWKYKQDVMKVIAACATVGLVQALL